MIGNLLEEGGTLRRLLSAAMAIMLAVTLAIPQGLAVATPAPVSEDVETSGVTNNEDMAQPVVSESNTNIEMIEKENESDQEKQPEESKVENLSLIHI